MATGWIEEGSAYRKRAEKEKYSTKSAMETRIE